MKKYLKVIYKGHKIIYTQIKYFLQIVLCLLNITKKAALFSLITHILQK